MSGFPRGGGGGGGGVLPSNYVTLENTNAVTPTLAGVTINVWDLLNNEGTTGAALKSDDTALQITATGLFVVMLSVWGFSWTQQAGGGGNALRGNLAFTVADTNSLAHDQGPDGWQQQSTYDERLNMGGGPVLLVTTPPLRLQADDLVSATLGLIEGATAGTAPTMPSGGTTLTIVQLA